MNAKPRDEAVRRLRAVIAASRPAAVAGWPEYWARLADLDITTTRMALEALAGTGEVRRVALADRVLYVADPPHAARR